MTEPLLPLAHRFLGTLARGDVGKHVDFLAFSDDVIKFGFEMTDRRLFHTLPLCHERAFPDRPAAA